MAFIYVITNDINGKQYVGKTTRTIQQRFKEHLQDSKRQHCEKRPLYVAMNKYGIEHFHINKLEQCNVEDANNREIYWIGRLNTYGSTGYNATLGGDSKHYYDYDKLANAYLELGTLTAVCKKFNCDIDTVKTAYKENNIDIKSSSDISKEKNSKKICMLDKKTHVVLKIFNSMMDAEKFLRGTNKAQHIGKVCNGLRKTAYGYV